MGNSRNIKRKKVRIPPRRDAKKFKGREPYCQNPGPSKAKIGDLSETFGTSPGHIDSASEGSISMDLTVLFGVFDQVLKRPECGNNMTSHVDTKKKHVIVLQCNIMECEWKYSFSSSQKQGHSYEVNVRGAWHLERLVVDIQPL